MLVKEWCQEGFPHKRGPNPGVRTPLDIVGTKFLNRETSAVEWGPPTVAIATV
jgi:hypothetical protein